MARDLTREERKDDQLKLCDFCGRNVLIDYYIYREVLNFPFILKAGLRTCLKADCMGEGIDLVAFGEASDLGWQQQ
jgi:hypothetical protein